MKKLFNKLALISWLSVAPMANSMEPITDNLQLVGSAKLEMYFFDIYNSELFTATGKYQKGEYPIALKITYLRDIDAEDLVEQTAEEWQKLGFEPEMTRPWLTRLTELWPDIEENDQLIFYVQKDGSNEFFCNGESLGSIQSEGFSDKFLAIWLDENSSHPKLTKKLTGG